MAPGVLIPDEHNGPEILSAPSQTGPEESSDIKASQSLAHGDEYGSYCPADPKELNLESNFGPMPPELMGYLQPTPADAPIELMRERMQKDGYLLVGYSQPIHFHPPSIFN